MTKRIRQKNSVTVGHPDSIDAYARELEERGESFCVDVEDQAPAISCPTHTYTLATCGTSPLR